VTPNERHDWIYIVIGFAVVLVIILGLVLNRY